MNLWSSLVPEQRIAYQPPVAKPKEDKREQLLNDAALRSEKSRTKREQHKAEIARLMELANGKAANKTQGEALEEKRAELGLKKCELAAIIGVSKHYYSDLIAGRRMLHLAAARRAYALGVDAGVLLAGNAGFGGKSQEIDDDR